MSEPITHRGALPPGTKVQEFEFQQVLGPAASELPTGAGTPFFRRPSPSRSTCRPGPLFEKGT